MRLTKAQREALQKALVALSYWGSGQFAVLEIRDMLASAVRGDAITIEDHAAEYCFTRARRALAADRLAWGRRWAAAAQFHLEACRALVERQEP